MSSIPRFFTRVALTKEMEKFKALAEYNDLAFIDLEQRLSAVRKF